VLNVFVVRPRGLNVGNDVIAVAARALLREVFGGDVNLVQTPADGRWEDAGESGLRQRMLHQMNLYGHGVVVGGGNLYENGQLDIDVNGLPSLRPPLLLFSLSHGRIHDHLGRLSSRTDAMPDAVIRALNGQAAISSVRDDATLEHLRALGLEDVVLGGCPTLLVDGLLPRLTPPPAAPSGVLLSIRNPQLMSVPLRDQGRVHAEVLRIIDVLEQETGQPVRLLCHDTRDMSFASSLGDHEYVLPDDVFSYLDLLRDAELVVSFRLHAFVPCMSFGTPAVNISYDERSSSLVRTIGLADWDIDFVGEGDVAGLVRERVRSLDELARLRDAAQPRWRELESAMRGVMGDFATRVRAYAAEEPPPRS
jgi:hypothetical protein